MYDFTIDRCDVVIIRVNHMQCGRDIVDIIDT